VVERNVQRDHIRPVGMIPPKVSISDFMGRLKGQTSMKLFHEFRHLKKKPYGGNHFWAKGSCVDTIGLDADMIRKYVRYQEEKEKQLEQLQLCDEERVGCGTTRRALPPPGAGLCPSYGGILQSRILRVRMVYNKKASAMKTKSRAECTDRIRPAFFC
jgi:hypothetical protein